MGNSPSYASSPKKLEVQPETGIPVLSCNSELAYLSPRQQSKVERLWKNPKSWLLNPRSMPGDKWKSSPVSKGNGREITHFSQIFKAQFKCLNMGTPGPLALAAESARSPVSPICQHWTPSFFTFDASHKILQQPFIAIWYDQLPPPPNPQTAVDLMEEESKRLRAQAVLSPVLVRWAQLSCIKATLWDIFSTDQNTRGQILSSAMLLYTH